MYHQQPGTKNFPADNANQQNYIKAIGREDAEYSTKINWLKKRWDATQDSAPARLICPLLYAPAAPLFHAVIADNFEYFKQNYNPESVNLNRILAIACLCGSEHIADFVLKQLKSNYLSPEQEYMLGYVAASMNTKWAENIARTMANAGKNMPASAQDFATDQVVNSLEKIFNKSVNKTSRN